MLRIVLSDFGRSAVYNVYNRGPRMLPCGTPESIGSKVDVLLLSETVKYLSLRQDFNMFRYPGGRVCLISVAKIIGVLIRKAT